MLKAKNFGQLEIIKVLKDSLQAINASHQWYIDIFVRKYLVTFVQNTSIENGLFLSLEAI